MGENNAESINNELFYHYAENFSPQKLTIEQLRSFKEFKDISESVALNIIEELYKLAIITYKVYSKG